MREALALYGATREGTFRTQRPAIARAFWTLLDERKEHSVRKLSGTKLRRVPTYEIDAPFGAAPRKPTARCDRRMEIRGAFLACGSIASPARGYHLEFVPPAAGAAARLLALLRADGRSPKTAERKNRTVIYFKDADEIVRLLTAIGAYNAVLHLEDVRALKETKNRIHRLVNTEAANVERAAGAAAAQRDAIELVADAYGLTNLSRPLREVAELRLAHPSETLAELGRRCDPQAKKSTVNGRITAIVRLARSLAQKAGSTAKGTVSD